MHGVTGVWARPLCVLRAQGLGLGPLTASASTCCPLSWVGVLGGCRRGAETITTNHQTHEQKQRPLGCQYSHHRLHAGCGCGQPSFWSFKTQSPNPVYTLPLRIKRVPSDMLSQYSIQCRCVCSSLLQVTGANGKGICSSTLSEFYVPVWGKLALQVGCGPTPEGGAVRFMSPARWGGAELWWTPLPFHTSDPSIVTAVTKVAVPHTSSVHLMMLLAVGRSAGAQRVPSVPSPVTGT